MLHFVGGKNKDSIQNFLETRHLELRINTVNEYEDHKSVVLHFTYLVNHESGCLSVGKKFALRCENREITYFADRYGDDAYKQAYSKMQKDVKAFRNKMLPTLELIPCEIDRFIYFITEKYKSQKIYSRNLLFNHAQ